MVQFLGKGAEAMLLTVHDNTFSLFIRKQDFGIFLSILKINVNTKNWDLMCFNSEKRRGLFVY